MTVLGIVGLVVVVVGTLASLVLTLRAERITTGETAPWPGWSDALAAGLFVLAVVVMTFPLALRPGEGLPSSGRDIFTAQWQIWWLGRAIRSGQSPNFTPFLFHPTGLNITFQPRRWAALSVWLPLRWLFGDIAGHNISAMLGLLASACTAYLLVLKLTHKRVAAWIGGAFFAFYPQHLIDALAQPNTGSTQWVPLFLLGLVVGLGRLDGPSKPRRVAFVFASFALSLNAYVTVKAWIQAAVVGALFVGLAVLFEGWWRKRAFWEAIGLFLALSLILVLPILLPFLTAADTVQAAIETTPLMGGADVLSYVTPAQNLPPFVPPGAGGLLGIEARSWPRGFFYLGLTTLALVAVGLADLASRQRARLPWVVVALVLWSLTLGTVLNVSGQELPGAWTPYQVLQHNPAFQAMRRPHRFAHGFSVAWAVLVGYGAASLWRLLSARERLARAALGLVGLLMLYEISMLPLTIQSVRVSRFYRRTLVNEEAGAIVDLPMGRQEAKEYMFLQTFHQRPIVEGVVARMPADAYDYIGANPLLRAWEQKEALTCDYDVQAALDALYADGFRHVVVHGKNVPKWLTGYFATVQPVHDDKLVTVYALADLQAHPPCP